MADGDSLFGFDFLGDDLCFLLGFLHRAEITSARRCRNDVVAVVTMTVQAVKVNRDLDIRIRRTLRRMTDGDLLALRRSGGRGNRRR